MSEKQFGLMVATNKRLRTFSWWECSTSDPM
jgi:hypothetical protein